MKTSKFETNWAQFIPLVIVFFFWGFVAASNDILIPVFKNAFSLTQSQSQWVSLAFYIAYTVGSLIYMAISIILKQDIVSKIGYKNGLALGLLISAVGTLLFYPAANNGSFALMLAGLFIVALGFSLQQTVANPLAIALGSAATGAQRLTLAGGINNLGTTIGPLIVSYAVFGTDATAATGASIESVKIPYIILGIVFVIVALLLKFSSLPDKPMDSESIERDEPLLQKSALHYPQLVLGMIAIFVYVGVEVATASNLPAFMETKLNFSTKVVAPYISLYWASLMIGRWTGAVQAFSLYGSVEKIFKFLAPYLAFAVFLFVNALAKHDLSNFFIYSLIIIVLIAADIASKGNPARMLLIFSILGIVSLLIGILSSGMVCVYAFISVGLFCSTLWPCIFTLAIAGLGKSTSQGSSFLIMMIMGGGIISWLQGFIAESIGIQNSYIVGVFCFMYLVFYAYKVTAILKSQGINFDNKTALNH